VVVKEKRMSKKAVRELIAASKVAKSREEQSRDEAIRAVEALVRAGYECVITGYPEGEFGDSCDEYGVCVKESGGGTTIVETINWSIPEAIADLEGI